MELHSVERREEHDEASLKGVALRFFTYENDIVRHHGPLLHRGRPFGAPGVGSARHKRRYIVHRVLRWMTIASRVEIGQGRWDLSDRERANV